MKQTLIRLQCDSCMLGDSYKLKLVRQESGDNTRFTLEYEGWKIEGETEHEATVDVPVSTVEAWLDNLTRMAVPVVANGISCCDGYTIRFEFNQGLNESRFQWCCDAPHGYRPLVDFGNILLEKVGAQDRLVFRESDD